MLYLFDWRYIYSYYAVGLCCYFQNSRLYLNPFVDKINFLWNQYYVFLLFILSQLSYFENMLASHRRRSALPTSPHHVKKFLPRPQNSPYRQISTSLHHAIKIPYFLKKSQYRTFPGVFSHLHTMYQKFTSFSESCNTDHFFRFSHILASCIRKSHFFQKSSIPCFFRVSFDY